MLYDGALRFIGLAKDAMRRQDLFGQNQNLQRAQKVVSELMSSLDMERGGEVATNLFSLYGFVYNQLVVANVEDSEEALEQASRVLRELRGSWAQLDQQIRKPASEENDGNVVRSAA